jgi:hypothetical protein
MPVFLSFFSNGKVTFPTGLYNPGRVTFAMHISHLSDVHCIDYAQQACTYERSYVIIFLDIFIIFFPGSKG